MSKMAARLIIIKGINATQPKKKPITMARKVGGQIAKAHRIVKKIENKLNCPTVKWVNNP